MPFGNFGGLGLHPQDIIHKIPPQTPPSTPKDSGQNAQRANLTLASLPSLIPLIPHGVDEHIPVLAPM